jgi:hypothetical protein
MPISVREELSATCATSGTWSPAGAAGTSGAAIALMSAATGVAIGEHRNPEKIDAVEMRRLTSTSHSLCDLRVRPDRLCWVGWQTETCFRAGHVDSTGRGSRTATFLGRQECRRDT